MLVETDAGTTASTVLSKKAEARTAKRTAIGEKHLPLYTDRQTEELASRPPLRSLWVSFFFNVFFYCKPVFSLALPLLGWAGLIYIFSCRESHVCLVKTSF